MLEAAEACARLGSPLYAGLLRRTAADVERGGPTWRVLEAFTDWPKDSAFVLRFMGAVHRLVLRGEAPALAVGFARASPDEAWPAFVELVERRGDSIRSLALSGPVQTNEVGRCAALAPAMLWLSRGMPLRLLELGASAGLNLRWDAYRYEDAWGDPASPVRLVDRYPGSRPPFEPASVEVAERRGCDPLPIDPASDEGRLTLESFVWPDQRERVELLHGALGIARNIPATVDAAPASAWLADALHSPVRGCTTIVFHSIVWQYLDDAERDGIREALARAGSRAEASAPLAWLRMEPAGSDTTLRATVWPGGRDHLIARAGFHGRPVTWLAGSPPAMH